MPSGSLIAFHQLEHEKNSKVVKEKIVFSEKNCLRHGEFDVNINSKYSIFNSLSWNKDLPLVLLLKSTETAGSCVQLYYRSNYKWYLKFNLETDSVSAAFFSDFSSLKLFILFKNGSARVIEFKHEYLNSVTTNNTESDISWLCNTDGNELHLTPMGRYCIPPPMSYLQIKLEDHDFPICVKWFNGHLAAAVKNRLYLVYFNDERYDLVKLDCPLLDDSLKDFLITGDLLFLLKTENETDVLIKLRIVFKPTEDFPSSIVNESERKLLTKASGIYPSALADSLDDKEFYSNKASEVTGSSPDDLFSGLMANEDIKKTNDIYLVMKDENFKKLIYRFDKHSLNSSRVGDFAIDGEVLKLRTFLVDKIESVFVLSSKKRLQLNNYLLADEVSSFEIYRNYLLFVQESDGPYNTLHIVDLKNEFSRNSLKDKQANFFPNFDERSFRRRTVERGARICAVSGVNVFLQMPRGNIEGFSPRYIATDKVISLLYENKLKEAYSLVRKNKMSMNILYDFNPLRFIESAEDFISQVNNEDFLNIFINSLTNELSFEAKEMKPEEYEDRMFCKKFIGSKVNLVCETLINALKKTKPQFVSSILQCHMKKDPPEYLKALILVQEMLEKTKTDSTLTKKADAALEFLCWIAQADILFDFSLKTYNFELVIMVAKHTNRDPKAYLAYLAELQKMPPNLMKYKVNFDLRHYSDALKEIAVNTDDVAFETAMSLIKQYKLFEQAEGLFTDRDKYALVINSEYAVHLEKEGDHVKSGEYYFKAGEYSKAANVFAKGASCKGVIKSILRGKIENDTEIIDSLIDACHLLRKTEELHSLIIFRPETEIKVLTEAIKFGNWDLSYYVYSATNSPIVIQNFIEKVKFSYELEVSELSKNRQFFEEKVDRLAKVQKEKKKDPEFLDFAAEELNDESFSESGSVTSSKKSFTTNASQLTKKNLQKIKNRKVREGHPLEEIYLIELLEELKLTQKSEEKLRELARILRLANFKQEAETLEKEIGAYKEVTNLPKSLNALQQLFLDKHPECIALFEIQMSEEKKKAKRKFIEIR